MKDRLTKKRVKVDYEAIIKLLGLSYEYRVYHFNRRSELKPLISKKREMRYFLQKQGVSFYWCSLALKDGCEDLPDLIAYCGSYKAAMEYAYEL